jgi:hypothetical protein
MTLVRKSKSVPREPPNSRKALHHLGQSVWLDYLRRDPTPQSPKTNDQYALT